MNRLSFVRAAFALVIAFSLNAPVCAQAPIAADSGATLIVFDASGSMRGRIDGETKMEIARRVVRDLVNGLPEGTRLGLVAYGHRKSSDCNDIELLIPPGTLNKAAFIEVVNGIQPRGMTPLSASVVFAAEALAYKEQKANVVLITDGLETCGKDPCATARALEKAAADLTVHTVAFDLTAREAKSIECIARETGGRFLQAKDASSLKDALELAVVETVVASAPPPAEVISPATVQGPPEAVMGAKFSVTWTGPDNRGDAVMVAKAGAPDDQYENFTYTRQGSPLELTAPIDAGPAELRYVTAGSRHVLARAPIVIVPAPVRVDAAEEAVAGSRVSISWIGPNNQGDYLTIVAKGAAEGEYGAYTGTNAGMPLTVTAPVEPGDAEIRYMSGQGGRVLARREIKIIAAEVAITAPAEVTAGSPVSIEWSGPNNTGDYLTIVSKGTPDGRYGNYTGTNSGSPLTVVAPVEAGEAEIRYMTGQGGRVLARRPLSLVAAAVTLSATAEVSVGAAVSIEWTGPNNAGDYLTIVAKSAPDGRYGNYTGTNSGSPLIVTAPMEAGEAEVRYMSAQGGKVLARRTIMVKSAEVTLQAADEAVVGSSVAITWTGPNNRSDYLTIVAKSLPDGRYERYTNTTAGSPLNVVAPIVPGEAEIRYMSGQGAKVLGRRPLRLVAAAITLEAPAQVPAGSSVNVTWTGPNNAGDYLTIVPKGTPEGTSQRYAFTTRGSPAAVAAPATPGLAEVRYVSGQGNRVLARIDIELIAPAK